MLPFEEWYALLCADAKSKDKLNVVEICGCYVWRLFWEDGVEPSVDAVLNSIGKI